MTFAARIGISTVGLLLAAALMTGGCNTKPHFPTTADKPFDPVKVMAVDKNDPQEMETITALEKARAQYRYDMQVLEGYYLKIGNLDKYNWARDERANLEEARTFEWENLPQIIAPQGANVANADERDLVEHAYASRRAYMQAVEDAIVMYRAKRHDFKLRVVLVMKERLDTIRLFPYFPESMLPGRELRCTEVIPEAEALYAEGQKLFWEGKGLAHTFITTSYKKERRACQLLLELVYNHPTSVRTPMAAYYIAEINKEYFKENTLAVFWYERAWTWDKHLPEPARFQAATVYDSHLRNYAKAVWCYDQSLRYDPKRFMNDAHCRNRIQELTNGQ